MVDIPKFTPGQRVKYDNIEFTVTQAHLKGNGQFVYSLKWEHGAKYNVPEEAMSSVDDGTGIDERGKTAADVIEDTLINAEHFKEHTQDLQQACRDAFEMLCVRLNAANTKIHNVRWHWTMMRDDEHPVPQYQACTIVVNEEEIIGHSIIETINEAVRRASWAERNRPVEHDHSQLAADT